MTIAITINEQTKTFDTAKAHSTEGEQLHLAYRHLDSAVRDHINKAATKQKPLTIVIATSSVK